MASSREMVRQKFSTDRSELERATVFSSFSLRLEPSFIWFKSILAKIPQWGHLENF